MAASGESIQAYDRIAIASLEAAGIAGVVLWPAGHLQAGGTKVETWDVLPVTPEELASFRAGGQQAWMDRVEQANGFSALHARWSARPPARRPA